MSLTGCSGCNNDSSATATSSTEPTETALATDDTEELSVEELIEQGILENKDDRLVNATLYDENGVTIYIEKYLTDSLRTSYGDILVGTVTNTTNTNYDVYTEYVAIDGYTTISTDTKLCNIVANYTCENQKIEMYSSSLNALGINEHAHIVTYSIYLVEENNPDNRLSVPVEVSVEINSGYEYSIPENLEKMYEDNNVLVYGIVDDYVFKVYFENVSDKKLRVMGVNQSFNGEEEIRFESPFGEIPSGQRMYFEYNLSEIWVVLPKLETATIDFGYIDASSTDAYYPTETITLEIPIIN